MAAAAQLPPDSACPGEGPRLGDHEIHNPSGHSRGVLGVPLTPSPSWLRVFTSGTGRFPASQPSCLAAQPWCSRLCRSSGVACGLYGLRPGRLAGCWLIARLRCRVNHARLGSHGQHACCFLLRALALAIWQRPRRLSAIAGFLRRLSAAMLTSDARAAACSGARGEVFVVSLRRPMGPMARASPGIRLTGESSSDMPDPGVRDFCRLDSEPGICEGS